MNLQQRAGCTIQVRSQRRVAQQVPIFGALVRLSNPCGNEKKWPGMLPRHLGRGFEAYTLCAAPHPDAKNSSPFFIPKAPRCTLFIHHPKSRALLSEDFDRRVRKVRKSRRSLNKSFDSNELYNNSLPWYSFYTRTTA